MVFITNSLIIIAVRGHVPIIKKSTRSVSVLTKTTILQPYPKDLPKKLPTTWTQNYTWME